MFGMVRIEEWGLEIKTIANPEGNVNERLHADPERDARQATRDARRAAGFGVNRVNRVNPVTRWRGTPRPATRDARRAAGFGVNRVNRVNPVTRWRGTPRPATRATRGRGGGGSSGNPLPFRRMSCDTSAMNPSSIGEHLLPVDALRAKMARVQSQGGRRLELWNGIRRLACGNPSGNPWFLPFVAVMEQDPVLLGLAKKAVADYLDEAAGRGSTDYLFNIWCFSFPHCRWALWFDFLRRAGAYSAEEADELAAQFLLIQFRDHHAGLRIKPEPECVDNQTASLVLSSYLVGSLFADGPGDGHLARLLRSQAAPRLEAMIGGMPPSGYSGEGSTYQGRIVAFAIPLLLETLEHLRGVRDLAEAPLAPNGTAAADVLRMTRNLWLPGALLLPWDDYGWEFGITFPLAYLASRTGDRLSLRILEKDAPWARFNSSGAGWGYDEPVWTLIHWPDLPGGDPPAWEPWRHPDLGGTLVDPAGETYLMQMWDPTAPMCTRAHVNPNAVILSYRGIPFSADGTDHDTLPALAYEGAVFHRTFGAGSSQRLNLSKGCGGSHSCLLVDGREGLRPVHDDYGRSTPADVAGISAPFPTDSIAGDVTGLYADAIPGTRRMRRRSTLVDNRFWLVEDLAVFDAPHDVVSRWWFRPGAAPAPGGGVDLRTSDGGLLQMRPLLPAGAPGIRRIERFPRQPDNASDRVDFPFARGETARGLWLLWPTTAFEATDTLDAGWTAWPLPVEAPHGAPAPADALDGVLEPGSLPWLRADVPVVAEWRFRRTATLRPGSLLRLPRGLDFATRLWIGGTEVDLSLPLSTDLVTPLRTLDGLAPDGPAEIELAVRFAIAHTAERARSSNPDTPLQIGRAADGPTLASWGYDGRTVSAAATDGRRWDLPYALMEDAP
jgi:hypothetical protein